MPQNVQDRALQALTEWWQAMGVEVDLAELDVAETTGKAAQTARPLNPATEAEAAPLPARRRGKTLEDHVAEAKAMASSALSLAELKAAIEQFDGCPLKTQCERTVVFDGVENAPVMVIGEGPGAQEDRQGLPFVGKAGQLLDKMLASIGLDRTSNAFITNVNYWRPPGNRNPEPEELAVCRPFVDRMLELGAPKLVFAMGGVSAKSLLRTETGIMRLRGQETVIETPGGFTAPVIPMFHPAYLLRRPQDKSRAWRDLLLARQRLREMGVDI